MKTRSEKYFEDILFQKKYVTMCECTCKVKFKPNEDKKECRWCHRMVHSPKYIFRTNLLNEIKGASNE